MPEQNSLHIIQSLSGKWSRNNLLATVLHAVALALLTAAIGHYLVGLPLWAVIMLFVATIAVTLWIKRPRPLTPAAISSFLNRSYPQLEESTQLLLIPEQSLSLLQQMQVQKIAPVLVTIPEPPAMRQSLRKALILLGSAVAGCVLIALLSFLLRDNRDHSNDSALPAVPIVKEHILPGIASFQIQVTPPAYTNNPARQQQQFSLKVEEGSKVQWEIHTNQKVAQLSLVLNSKDTLQLSPAAADSTTWRLQRDIREAGFYQVSLAGQASQLYTLEVIPDLPVTINIITPQQYSRIEPGREPLTRLSLQLTDDYGIKNAGIVATRASGKGESVSFKEQQLSFPVSFDGRRQMALTKILDLPALGMHAGDELYFYVKAVDNRGQESRSDMYFVSLPDTAELLSLSGMESGINQVPEYFRSQRQIIIDIEKLLQQQATIPIDTFHLRSNVLGDDQKLLRLRYGKFVGEEWESGGHSPDDGHDHGSGEHGEEKEIAFGDIKALEDQYAHKHDNAEDATYLEPAQKAQLKAILTEMWSSELKLRTYYPREALPFAYKALRLLKDMQQKSRAYVSKTSVKMPPLRPEKRLTGELDKIGTPLHQKNNAADNSAETILQQAMAVLEQLKQAPVVTPAQMPALLAAEKKISEKAVHAPVDYLPALNAIRQLTQEPGKINKAVIVKVQAAVQKMMKAGGLLPQPGGTAAGNELADYYFNNLNGSSH
ncbi:hypothetical protein D3H65_04165 [Paraflavitalea soli]|uniref:DUF4175 family protein n=1 Tax=Paraflavitalea soli TaxID=2315862 RepID=A0A3B7MI10_9BACT|nr:DUF4175 family protein [Paraflavitalea soli]AXY73217.1 hypothetical protein D3H65_04165 [Paraflavitalea soli]